MVLEITVSKTSVTQLNDDDYNITIHVLIVDGLEEIVLEKDYSERYYSAVSVESVRLKLQDKILEDWNKLMSEKSIFDAVAFDTMVSDIQNVANNYING